MITFGKHAFKGLDTALSGLHDRLQMMGGHIEKMMGIISEALDTPDSKFIEAKAIDREINEAEVQINTAVEEAISKFGPMGEELRFIIASIKVASLLERIADHMKNCVKRLPKINQPLDPAIRSGISQMLGEVRTIVPQSLGLMTDYDPEVVEAIHKQGDQAEAAYKRLLAHLHNTQGGALGAADNTHILMVAKNLERVADMAIDIAKICYFIHTDAKFDKSTAGEGEPS
ncbi:MAG: phosphate uptake regulator PhoU [Alphaproteobacteria bacterium]|nr:phosphate uptake regulator PhoU [Alphaproteobacteria bacterium]